MRCVFKDTISLFVGGQVSSGMSGTLDTIVLIVLTAVFVDYNEATVNLNVAIIFFGAWRTVKQC